MSGLLVPRRFCGPPSSGNGGWTAGALAELVEPPGARERSDAWPTIEVALRTPPPLDTPLSLKGVSGLTRLVDPDDRLVAEARVVPGAPDLVDPVEPEVARAAEATFPGFASHPFPGCFVCGPDREPGDGLRIFPGRTSAAGELRRVAASWTPHPSLAEDRRPDPDGEAHVGLATTWAALDCSGGWAAELEERVMLLGTMRARVDALPVIGETHVVTAEVRGTEGRKTHTAATLYDSDGRVVAAAEHVWIAVAPPVVT